MSTQWLALGAAVDPSWWRPLDLLSTRVAARPDLPPVIADDFLYCARVTRKDLPALHVYRHVLSQRQLCIDDTGAVWRYVARADAGIDHYARVDDLDEIVSRTELKRAELLSARTRPGRRAPGWDTPSEVAVALPDVADDEEAPAEVLEEAMEADDAAAVSAAPVAAA